MVVGDRVHGHVPPVGDVRGVYDSVVYVVYVVVVIMGGVVVVVRPVVA